MKVLNKFVAHNVTHDKDVKKAYSKKQVHFTVTVLASKSRKVSFSLSGDFTTKRNTKQVADKVNEIKKAVAHAIKHIHYKNLKRDHITDAAQGALSGKHGKIKNIELVFPKYISRKEYAKVNAQPTPKNVPAYTPPPAFNPTYAREMPRVVPTTSSTQERARSTYSYSGTSVPHAKTETTQAAQNNAPALSGPASYFQKMRAEFGRDYSSNKIDEMEKGPFMDMLVKHLPFGTAGTLVEARPAFDKLVREAMAEVHPQRTGATHQDLYNFINNVKDRFNALLPAVNL